MRRVTVEANDEGEAAQLCLEMAGFEPVEVREVDSGNEGAKAYICFESKEDAQSWDKEQS